MAIISFNSLAVIWSLLSLTTTISGVAAKGRGGGGGSTVCYDDNGYTTSCSHTNVGAIVGIVVGIGEHSFSSPDDDNKHDGRLIKCNL
jgi:hypothetical protein